MRRLIRHAAAELVLVDTGALFASLDADDPHHGLARDFLVDRHTIYVVTDTVFSEAMTLSKLHLGVQLAVSTGEALLAGPPFRFYRLAVEDADETWDIFSRYVDKEWSYVDCSLLAVARRLQLRQIFAFDHHFDQMASLGIRRVP